MNFNSFVANTIDSNLDSDRIQDIISWADSKGIVDISDYITLANGNLCHRDDAWCCEKTDEWYSDDETQYSVYCKRGDLQTWCEQAKDDGAFYCENNHEYYCSSWYSEIEVDGDTVCAENTTYYEWSDGSYHYEEEEKEEDVPGYHDSYRPWEEKNYGKKLVFGCELEVLALEDRVEIKNIANSLDLIGEQDGSLDSYKGIEIIGAPETLEEHKNENGRWMKFLSRVKGKALGWDADKREKSYGLHISVNRGALTDYHTGKLLVFINSNKDLCEKVAGRKNVHYCRFYDKKISDGKRRSSDKYEALSIASDTRLECRIFRSTLNPLGFKKNVEFLASAVEFTKFSSHRNLTENAYKEWLKKNNKNYKNIATFLQLVNTKADAARPA